MYWLMCGCIQWLGQWIIFTDITYAQFYELGISRESRYILGIRNKSVLWTLKSRAIPWIRYLGITRRWPRNKLGITMVMNFVDSFDEKCWCILEPTSQIGNNNLVRPSQNARGVKIHWLGNAEINLKWHLKAMSNIPSIALLIRHEICLTIILVLDRWYSITVTKF